MKRSRLTRRARLRKFSRRSARPLKSQGKGKTGYESRTAVLRALGFRSYGAYLASDLWHAIRLQVLERDGFTCRTCPRGADVVHHVSYDYAALSGEDIEKLLALCRYCHERIEMDSKNRKRTFERAKELTRRMVRAYEMEPA